ncbi:MAG: biotin--[acetyl-CoA-carboxylase] ligase [Ruminococcaceae bacterium]|nr:biotin--[acetyl-CoA-carboxylase] ligase [Oscillospiraceae bacterium]
MSDNQYEKQIKKALRRSGLDFNVFCYDLIDSTNTEARRYALSGGKIPAVFIAEEQSAGRGRMGRSFYSPLRTGLYISLLLDIPDSDAVRLTTSAAVAVRKAVLQKTGIDLKIKWVNDLYLASRKVSGILAESVLVGEHRFTILGIGINLDTDFRQTELRDIAGSLGISPKIRPALASELIKDIHSVLYEEDPLRVIDEYRQSSCVLGKPVIFTENERSYTGIARDITDHGHLLVLLDGGNEKILSSGEISLRINNGELKS